MLPNWQHTCSAISEQKVNEKNDPYGCWDIGTGHALDSGIEIIERFTLNDLSTNFTSYTKLRESSLYSDQTEEVDESMKRKNSTSETHRLVFLTLLMIVSKSNGLMLLMLITSTLIPSLASFSAASNDRPTMSEWATIVTSVPSRSTFALPMGRTKSSESAS